jgi:serine/threonine protein kinase
MELVPGETRIGNYLFLKRLGSGSFASVWVAEHQITFVEVAIKVIPKFFMTTDQIVTRFTRELSLLKRFRHLFIAEFFESLEDDDYHYYVMEYCEHGTLIDFIRMNGPLSEAQASHYFLQLLSALEYLHKDLRVAHRDLKGQNIVLDRYDNIRLIDFGLSNQFTDTDPLLKSKVGTPAHAAPEMIQGHPYTQTADIWNAGVCLYVMVTGGLPFDDDNIQHLFHKIVNTEVTFPQFLSQAVVDVLKKMLTKAPEHRITLDEIKEHHWFSQTHYSKLLGITIADEFHGPALDQEIVTEMTALGLDCHALVQQIVADEFTELTSVYRMLARRRLTDRMKALRPTAQAAGQEERQFSIPLPAGLTKISLSNVPRIYSPAFPRATARSPVPMRSNVFSPKVASPIAQGRLLSQGQRDDTTLHPPCRALARRRPARAGNIGPAARPSPADD